MKLSEISDLVGGQLKGDGSLQITGIASLESAGEGEISFLAGRRFQSSLASSKASALLLPEGEWDLRTPHILCKNPYFAFALVMQRFHRMVEVQDPGIHRSAIVADDAHLGEEVSIGANVVIDSGVKIGNRSTVFPNCFIGTMTQVGEDVTIYPNVTIRESVEIGNRVIIHPGAVIGCDGFGYAEENGRMVKIPQRGTVVIEDDVEIGANCCIDRATLGETRIHRGVKLDNLIQIAHNAEIDEHSAVAAQSGVSGSSKIGRHSKIGGQVGLVDHITLGDYTTCGAQAGITKSHPDHTILSGYPARPHREQLKIEAAQGKLPQLIRKLAEIERRLDELESSINGKSETEQ